MCENKSNLADVDVVVRAARREDMAAVAGMIQELADFEKMSDGPKINQEILERDGFVSSPPRFQCLVAEVPAEAGAGKEAAGYAIYFPTYSTWEGLAYMLEDLYVRPQWRRKGVGGRLFDAVAKQAVSAGASRLDFHVLSWNPALQFYRGRGAADLSGREGWLYCRLAGPALAQRAQRGVLQEM